MFGSSQRGAPGGRTVYRKSGGGGPPTSGQTRPAAMHVDDYQVCGLTLLI